MNGYLKMMITMTSLYLLKCSAKRKNQYRTCNLP